MAVRDTRRPQLDGSASRADFTEFGRSGRRYTRAEILAVEVGEIHVTLPLRELQCRRLGGSVVLVTYQTEVDGLLANRSSIWQLTDAGEA